MKDFLMEHFAVLLVTGILVLLLSVYVIETHTTGNDAVLTWLQTKISEALSAIFMGLAGPTAYRWVRGGKLNG